MTRVRATAIGFTAILMWALLALLAIGSAPVPPFLLNALCFGIGGTLALIWVMAGPGLAVLRGVSWKVYAFGTLGLFGYHALYFTAFRIAPAAETGLIAYLWPLFIVLFSGLLPGERLSLSHVLGAVIAFGGAALILMARGEGGGALPLALRDHLGGLFGPVAATGRGADRKRDGLLPGHGGSVAGGASDLGKDGLAGQRLGLAGGRGPWPGSGGRGFLHLGYRHEKRRHPALGCRLLCCAAAFNHGAGCGRKGAGDPGSAGRGCADHRRGGAGRPRQPAAQAC
jgi:uncharacterized membrane protein